MPYTTLPDQRPLNPHIDELAKQIVLLASPDKGDFAFAGHLNYVCTRLALKVIKLRFAKIRYGIFATTSGVFHHIADEFYRRLVTPYEDIQIRTNGDVDLYAEFEAELKSKLKSK
jgi:hypothetical protein